MAEIPRIISVDDHVVEPPDLWSSRLPAQVQGPGAPGRAQADGPRRSSAGGRASAGGSRRTRLGRRLVLRRPGVADPDAVGGRRLQRGGVRDHHLRRDPPGRLEARPSGCRTWTRTTWRPRSASRTPCPGSAARRSSSAPTRSSALLCVQAYNDWMIDEWCGRRRRGPPDPADHRPAVGPRAGGGRGPARRPTRAATPVTFPENPHALGLPSIHDKDGFWDPFFRPARRPTRRSACTSARRRRCRARRPTRRSSSARR